MMNIVTQVGRAGSTKDMQVGEYGVFSDRGAQILCFCCRDLRSSNADDPADGERAVIAMGVKYQDGTAAGTVQIDELDWSLKPLWILEPKARLAPILESLDWDASEQFTFNSPNLMVDGNGELWTLVSRRGYVNLSRAEFTAKGPDQRPYPIQFSNWTVQIGDEDNSVVVWSKS
jgi:hypothetical protein